MRISRSTGALSGLLIILLGIWGGIIPFVGPYFHYSFGSNATWHFTLDRLWLDILPAVAAILGGVMLLMAGHRVSGALGSWVAMVAGAWFAVGPAVSRIWEHAAGPIGAPLYGSVRQMAELVGYFHGLGVLIVALAAVALGRFVSRPPLGAQPVTSAPAREAVVSARKPEAGVPVAQANPTDSMMPGAPAAAEPPVVAQANPTDSMMPGAAAAGAPVEQANPTDSTAPVFTASRGRERAAGEEEPALDQTRTK